MENWCVHLAETKRETKTAVFMGNSNGRAGVEALAGPPDLAVLPWCLLAALLTPTVGVEVN